MPSSILPTKKKKKKLLFLNKVTGHSEKLRSRQPHRSQKISCLWNNGFLFPIHHSPIILTLDVILSSKLLLLFLLLLLFTVNFYMLSVPEARSVQNSTAVASYTSFFSRILGGNLVKRTVATAWQRAPSTLCWWHKEPVQVEETTCASDLI